MTITASIPEGLDAYIEQARQAWGAPGLAIAVVKDDAVVFAKGYGVRALDEAGPVDEHTLFAVASTTKAYTAATLGLLVDEGKLNWDDPVTKHLPWFQLYDPYVTRELTVRDLLCHRCGLARGDTLWYATDFSREEVLRRVRHLAPSWSFRARYAYQNIMFLAASAVVEAVSGASWDDFIKDRLFKPLGMARSNTSVRDLEGAANVAAPHHINADGIQRIPYWNVDNIAGAGANNSCAIEMAQWVRLNLAEGMYGDQRVLSAEVVREMQTPQMINNDPERLKTDEILKSEINFQTYGLGWAVFDYRGYKCVGHGGGLDGMRSEVGLLPAARLGVVVLTNMTRAGGSYLPNAIRNRALDAYLGAPERDWSADYLKVMGMYKAEEDAKRRKMEEAHVAGTTPSLPLDAYAGMYSNTLYGEAQVAVEGGRLVFRFYRLTGDLDHWHYDTFQVTWRNPGLDKAYARFTLDGKGRPEQVWIDGWSETLGFTRTFEDDATAG